MFKYIHFGFLITALIMLGCACSHKKNAIPEEYSNQVELTPPVSDENTADSKIYIDSAGVIDYDNTPSLLVLGTFPDGCTKLGSAKYQDVNGTISLTLDAWRNTEQMCTQALVAFSFVYRQIPERILQEADSITINGTDFTLNR